MDQQAIELLNRAVTERRATVIAAFVLYALIAIIKRVPFVKTKLTATPWRTRATAVALSVAPALVVTLSGKSGVTDAALTSFITFAVSTALDKFLGSDDTPGEQLTLFAFACALAAMQATLAGCGSVPRDALESGRDVVNVSEPCLVAQHDAALERCGTDEACKTKVRESFAPIADAFDRFNALWCELKPNSEGCDK